MRVLIGICLMLFDMLVNYQTLVTKQPFFPGVSMDYVQFIVLFNAGMIPFILLVDWIGSALRKLLRNYRVGTGINDMYRHEHP